MNILGIETSCDETAAAVVADGRHVLSSVVSSQTEIHGPYGGVVPELASRKHIENILPVVNQAITEAGLKQSDIDAVAATQGPGLMGALLIGFSFAKAFALARQLPLAAVNHLDGHLASVMINDPPPCFPFVALLVSGGHTALYRVDDRTQATLLGQTRDDAAGEAFDKVAKMLNLGYPGGEIIGRRAAAGDAEKVRFSRPFLDKNKFDFSFSGIKTAVLRHIEAAGANWEAEIDDIAAGFQEAVVDVLCHKLIHAALVERCPDIALVGGVAANNRLREKLTDQAMKNALRLHIPHLEYCGDNAAMIAAAGFYRLQESPATGSFLDLDVYSRVPPAP